MHGMFERHRQVHHGPHRGPEHGPGRHWGPRRRNGPWRQFETFLGPEPGFGRRERMERGVLRYLILDALTDGPKHGYEIIKWLEERTHGQYAPSPGTVYPTLQLLEDQGLVRAEAADGRKVYTLTEAGTTDLAAHADTVAAIFGRFAGHGAPRDEAPEAAFLRDELQDLTRTVGLGVQVASDPATLRRIRQALERCKEEVRTVIASSTAPESTPPPASEAR